MCHPPSDPEVKTDYYNDSTALHLAATHGCLEAVKLLLDPTLVTLIECVIQFI